MHLLFISLLYTILYSKQQFFHSNKIQASALEWKQTFTISVWVSVNSHHCPYLGLSGFSAFLLLFSWSLMKPGATTFFQNCGSFVVHLWFIFCDALVQIHPFSCFSATWRVDCRQTASSSPGCLLEMQNFSPHPAVRGS